MSTFKANWAPVQNTSSSISIRPWTYQEQLVNRRVLYLYFDESGNFDFRESGTPFFLMTCAATSRPFNTGKMLTDLRYDLIEHGKELEEFHACEDSREVRSAVYDVLGAMSETYRVYTAYVQKSDVPNEFRSPDAVYSKVFEVLMDEVCKMELGSVVEKVIAITDDLPQEAKKKQVTKPLKRYMKARFQGAGIPYALMHHRSCSDPNLQATDYFCWAAHRDLTQGKDWPLKACANSFREVGMIGFDR